MTNEDEQAVLNWAKQHVSYCSKSHSEDYNHTPDCIKAIVIMRLSIENNTLHSLRARGTTVLMYPDASYREDE